MTARKNTATAVSGGRRPRKTAAQKTTSTGTSLVLVDQTEALKDKLAGVAKVAAESPQSKVTDKPAEKAAEAPKAATKPESTKTTAKPAKPAKTAAAAKPAKVAKPKIEVTDADLAKLVYVPDSQGEKATTRHRESCPAYFDEKWGNATTFSKVTEKDRLGKLHACRACARRTAAERVAAK